MTVNFQWLKRIASVALALGCCLAALACTGSGPKSSGQEKRYELKGKIVSFDKGQQQVVIAHEEVPGFMEPMTMGFTLRQPDAYDVMRAGDEIQATLVVDGSRFWLENPIVTQAATTTDGARPAGETPSAVEPQPGSSVPAFALVNQDSKQVGLDKYLGRYLLVTFIYTRCPLPEYCTLMSTNFAEVNRALAQDPALRPEVHLLSVSIDPERDTPQVLRSYGAAHTGEYGAEKFEHWEFLTGQPEEVKKLATFFGLTYNEEGDQIVHSLRTALVSPEGKLLKLYRGNEWKPAEVVKDLQTALEGKPFQK
ncbi:MAG: SCO family protein [Pyrinomonadaceae bacterium]